MSKWVESCYFLNPSIQLLENTYLAPTTRQASFQYEREMAINVMDKIPCFLEFLV